MKQKYYAVSRGRKEGIFLSWQGCKNSIHRYSNATYEKFTSLSAAIVYLLSKGTIGKNARLYDSAPLKEYLRLIDSIRILGELEILFQSGFVSKDDLKRILARYA